MQLAQESCEAMYMLLTRDDARYFTLNFLKRLLESWLLESLALNFASNLTRRRFASFEFLPTNVLLSVFWGPLLRHLR
jgi:hypothetical protein